MQAVKLKLADRKPKGVPPDEERQEGPVKGTESCI